MKRLFAVAVALLLGACGGSSPETPVTCTPSGTWLTTITKGQASTSACAAITLSPAETDLLNIPSSGQATYTSSTTSSTRGYAGTITAACVANLAFSDTFNAGTDSAGTPITASATDSRELTFNGSSVTGTGTITVSTSSAVVGFPCTLAYSLAGTRQ